MKQCDLDVIEKRLTSDHITEKTYVFKDPSVSLVDNIRLRNRFEDYWKRWIARDVEEMIAELKYYRSRARVSKRKGSRRPTR